MAKAGNLKLDFMAKSIGIYFFEFEDIFRCYRDNENLKKHFGHMNTLNPSHLRFVLHGTEIKLKVEALLADTSLLQMADLVPG